MGRGRLRSWNTTIMQNLLDVSRGLSEADYYFTNGMMLDVYNGRIIETNLAVKGQRIAYQGSSHDMVGSNTIVIDLEGRIMVPGYIEAHAHPFQLFNPLAYADYVISLGTTCSINDDVLFMRFLPYDKIIAIIEKFGEHPVKMLWSARFDPQTFSLHEPTIFPQETVSQLIRHPWFAQVGEITDWPALLEGNQAMQQWMVEAGWLGKKAEGHAPGASDRTLNPLAAAGITACHESITSEDVLLRLQMGMYATLRNSSTRLDLASIVKGLMKHQNIAWERIMMTTDGPTAPAFKDGFNDALIKIAIENGMPAIHAYQLMSRNAAVYLGLDNEIGGLAPGRIADILVLDDLEHPTPRQVFADGRLVAERTDEEVIVHYPSLSIDWAEMKNQAVKRPKENFDAIWLQPLVDDNKTFPVMKLIDPVITKRIDYELGKEIQVSGNRLCISRESGLCYVALLARNFRQITHGFIEGFATKLDAIATSYTGSLDILTVGQNPSAMLQALRRVQELGGGIAVVNEGKIVAEISLPLVGFMSEQPMQHVIHDAIKIENAMLDMGYPFHDLFYTLLFITSTHLPEIRLTPEGIIDVKRRQLLRPSHPFTVD